ncbi:MAG: hypothetical protein RL220_826, partial [Bacteroidota bacterium]
VFMRPTFSESFYETGNWQVRDGELEINAKLADGTTAQHQMKIQTLQDSTMVLQDGKVTLYYVRKSFLPSMHMSQISVTGTRKEFMLISNWTDKASYIPFNYPVKIDLRDSLADPETSVVYRTLRGEVTGVRNGVLMFDMRSEDLYKSEFGVETSSSISYDDPVSIDIPEDMVEDLWYLPKHRRPFITVGGVLLSTGILYMVLSPQMTILRKQDFNVSNYNQNVLIGAAGVGLSIPFLFFSAKKHYSLWHPEFCPYETWSVYPTDR